MMQKDKYFSFAELAVSERGEFRITKLERDSPVLILAPHGGGIEPGTSEIAGAIAGSEFSCYWFESLKGDGNRDLHLTSYLFDEPECLRMLAAARTVIAVHGCEGEEGLIHVGGRDAWLRAAVIHALAQAGYRAVLDNSHHAGVAPRNICNRGTTGQGVQLEIDAGLRRRLFAGLTRADRRFRTPEFGRFVGTIRAILLAEDAHSAF